MKTTSPENKAKTQSSSGDEWPRQVSAGRGATKKTVTIYRRTTPSGNFAYMLANYADGKRRFDSYATEAEAEAAAKRVAERLSQQHVKAATLTESQAVEYIRANQVLAPYGVSVGSACETVADGLKRTGGDLGAITEALKLYAQKHRKLTPKRVDKVVEELLKIKKSRGASVRYMQDLRARLARFADAFKCEIGNVSTASVQEWLDGLKVSTQTYMNFRRVVHLLFEFAVARGYALENPVASVESVKVRNGAVEIFTPNEITRLLAAASESFLPCIAIGAFAGLRSAEIERLTWESIDMQGGNIIIGADMAKTASRRVVPMHDNLKAWLADYSKKTGNIWTGTHEEFYDAQQATAAATEVKADKDKGIAHVKPVEWKANGLRHSYASYRFAKIGDAGRVAGELGNSAAVVHKHYRELVKPAEADKWFAVVPTKPENVTSIAAAAAVAA